MKCEAEKKVLEWCRSKPAGYGLPCMREASDYMIEKGRKAYFICDNSKVLWSISC